MQIRIHRGASEIGGNCIELESNGYSIILDLGLPLSAKDVDSVELPDIRGLGATALVKPNYRYSKTEAVKFIEELSVR